MRTNRSRSREASRVIKTEDTLNERAATGPTPGTVIKRRQYSAKNLCFGFRTQCYEKSCQKRGQRPAWVVLRVGRRCGSVRSSGPIRIVLGIRSIGRTNRTVGFARKILLPS